MATEMPAAIRPYSIAVAPLSSLTNFANRHMTLSRALKRHLTSWDLIVSEDNAKSTASWRRRLHDQRRRR
jgi:hypothetical protein